MLFPVLSFLLLCFKSCVMRVFFSFTEDQWMAFGWHFHPYRVYLHIPHHFPFFCIPYPVLSLIFLLWFLFLKECQAIRTWIVSVILSSWHQKYDSIGIETLIDNRRQRNYTILRQYNGTEPYISPSGALIYLDLNNIGLYYQFTRVYQSHSNTKYPFNEFLELRIVDQTYFQISFRHNDGLRATHAVSVICGAANLVPTLWPLSLITVQDSVCQSSSICFHFSSNRLSNWAWYCLCAGCLTSCRA